ncbi:MAG: DegT/DnrJ/EryC1/StrS family aminotransferase [Hungatella sp.]|nr:DegT/DnrJ/EryC1/StrS family aminotransferase [Hungatella sp.]
MEFRDLKQQYKKLKSSIDQNIAEVISSAHFISGEQVQILERMLAEFVGVKHCISCGNGTDAISIALMAYGVGKEDAVFVPDFTFFSSGESPAAVGAVPVFVDVKEDTYNIDPYSLEKAIERVIFDNKYRPRAVIAVDLFGLPAEYGVIKDICRKYGLLLLEDGAQGFGGAINNQRVCSFGDISTTSFFPAKPLGCYGDGGAIFTDNDEIASICRSITVHGKNADDKYDNIRIGMNSRLDTLQAAILISKFEAFKKFELEEVNRIALEYMEKLKAIEGLVLPVVPEDYYSSWAQYTIKLPVGTDRNSVQNELRKQGIPTNIYYTKTMHNQQAFANSYSSIADCPVAERLCKQVLCLPIHPYLTKEEIEKVGNSLFEVLC